MGAVQAHTHPPRRDRDLAPAPQTEPSPAGPDADHRPEGGGLTTALSTVEETPYGVTLYWPSGSSPYFRMTWITPTGERKYSSGGRTHATAWAKACQIDDALAAAQAGADERTVDQLGAAWLADLVASWSDRYGVDQADRIAQWVGPTVGHVKAGALTRDMVRKLLATPPSRSVRRHLRATVGGMLKWGYDNDWTAGPRSALLPAQPKTAKRAAGSVHGENRLHIDAKLIPGPDACKALADAMRVVGGKRYGDQCWLMNALAASTGVRQGELFALRPSDVNLADGSLLVLRQLVRVKGLPPHETLPKWGRTGTTILPATTLWGEDLHGPLAQYLAGKDPEGLIFADTRGHWMTASNFDSRQLKPAREAAAAGGWAKGWSWHAHRHAFCSHLLAGGASAADVCLVARHRDPSVTLGMYYGATEGSLARLHAILS